MKNENVIIPPLVPPLKRGDAAPINRHLRKAGGKLVGAIDGKYS